MIIMIRIIISSIALDAVVMRCVLSLCVCYRKTREAFVTWHRAHAHAHAHGHANFIPPTRNLSLFITGPAKELNS